MLTQQTLKEYLHYNPNTGIFTWLKSAANTIKIGDVAGCVNTRDNYLRIGLLTKIYLAHRLAWLYMYGNWPKYHIDHINHNRADNRITNLREVTQQINNKNISLHKRNKSGCSGVVWNIPCNKWRSSIVINGKFKHIGLFDDLEQAIIARKTAEINYGFHPNHGT